MQPAEHVLSLWEAGLVSDGALADWMSLYLSENAPSTPLLIAIQQLGITQDRNRLNGALLSELLRAHALPSASFNLLLAYQLEGLKRSCWTEEEVLVFLIRQVNNPDCPPFMRHAIEQAETCWIDQGNKAGAWKIVNALLAEQQQRITRQLDKHRQLVAELFDSYPPEGQSPEDQSRLLLRET